VKNSDSSHLSTSTISTKRKVLAKVASIFDPLGLTSPSVIIFKTYLQKLWQNSLQWDEQLSPQLQGEWDKLCNTIPKLSEICINRKVVGSPTTNLQLHGICDSSERAYGACIYVRSTDLKQAVFCNLLCSSSRVAPLKKQTIPRLELCAAVLLAKLYKRVTAALNIPISATYLWTDSTIVLSWIQSSSNKWKTFVAHRIAFIQEETSSATWRHVPSSDNPADLVSRGIEPTILSSSTLWWNGPNWIIKETSAWPDIQLNPPTEGVELKRVYIARSNTTDYPILRFSNFNQLLRVTAHSKRFIHNCRQQPVHCLTTPLTTHELQEVLTGCIKLVQGITYSKELRDLSEQQ